jgi:hypothetical protein
MTAQIHSGRVLLGRRFRGVVDVVFFGSLSVSMTKVSGFSSTPFFAKVGGLCFDDFAAVGPVVLADCFFFSPLWPD